VVGVTVYVEGGGDRREQQARLRRAFSQFIEKAGLKARMPKVVACGDRNSAYKDFRSAHKASSRKALLLVDSEGPVRAESPWLHLQDRDGWNRLPNSTDDQYHLMVQTMESWFLDDRKAIADYYGPGFRSNAIPPWPEIELVPKSDVYDTLRRSTQDTRKGRYHKGRHSFEILRRLDPEKVVNSSAHAEMFVNSLKEFSSSA